MTTLIICGILVPVLLLGALCVWLAVRLQRAERELEMLLAVSDATSADRRPACDLVTTRRQ